MPMFSKRKSQIKRHKRALLVTSSSATQSLWSVILFKVASVTVLLLALNYFGRFPTLVPTTNEHYLPRPIDDLTSAHP